MYTQIKRPPKKSQNRPEPLRANGYIYRPDAQVLARSTISCLVGVLCVCVCVCTVVRLCALYLLNRTLCTPAAAVPSPESQISPFGCEALGSSGRQRSLLEREEKFCEMFWTLWRLGKSVTAHERSILMCCTLSVIENLYINIGIRSVEHSLRPNQDAKRKNWKSGILTETGRITFHRGLFINMTTL